MKHIAIILQGDRRDLAIRDGERVWIVDRDKDSNNSIPYRGAAGAVYNLAKNVTTIYLDREE